MAPVHRVVASNPSAFTGPGTNTWIIEDEAVAIVIDPGPDDPAHLEAIIARLAGKPVGAILVTHSHRDHLPLAAALADRTRARVTRWPELRDGDVVRAGHLSLTAVFTPGHCDDHLTFWMAEDRVAFCGDLILGRGSSVVTYPEGDVAAYIASLDRLAALQPRMLFPGHWDPVMDAGAKIAEYRAHRLQREQQVVDAMGAGPGDARAIMLRVYGSEVGEELLDAAEMSTRAHLKKLVDEGRVRMGSGAAGEETFELAR